MPKVIKKDIKDCIRFNISLDPAAVFLDPLPEPQSQEGPNCGFYALSVVLDYWKAAGKSKSSAPARKRDVKFQPRPQEEAKRPSLRSIGKNEVGALDIEGVAKVSSGGVFTVQQLAAVANAARIAGITASVRNCETGKEFHEVIQKALEADIPPIVALDVDTDGEPTNAGGQRSHWGVIVGAFRASGQLEYLATHSYSKSEYYIWSAEALWHSNDNLANTTRNVSPEIKARLERSFGKPVKGTWEEEGRFGYHDYEETDSLLELAESKNESRRQKNKAGSFEVGFRTKDSQIVHKPRYSVRQDLAHKILLVSADAKPANPPS